MKFKTILLLGCILTAFFASTASAREEYARRTGKGCMLCHSDELGGPLSTAGIAYIKNGYQYPVPDRLLKKADMVNSPVQMTIRFIIGYLHLFAAVILIGAIFYIHIFIGPKQLTTGIPKGERLLGLSCLATLTLTGIYLTWFRIDKLDHFINNAFGKILLVKIILFAIMLCAAILAVTVIHRKMSRSAGTPSESKVLSGLSMETISGFTGGDEKPAYIVHDRQVYDVTDSPKWKNGRHFGKHAAGTDLTEAMKSAPHGPEVLDRVRRIGDVVQSIDIKTKPTRVHQLFVFMAYTNMVIIVLILFCISLWRWGFSTGRGAHQGETAQAAKSCVECHRKLNFGIAADWETSVHSKVGVDCLKCHQVPAGGDQWANKAHLKHAITPIATVVSPLTCAQCHPKEVKEYTRSKHANTIAIMWKVDKWLQYGVNNETERISGCYACHGTVVELVDGKPVPGTWPNVGVGRINPDGSAGSCSS
ncbi:MAG TPA: CopD family protein, partial [Desulfatirhabdiaceae bacterium]|nr:CopD family protein [Desulfatirhabdiaceae bacterium]